MEDDASLVQKTIAGETSAFALLYDRYARVVRAVCFDTTKEVTVAQELAQEAFLRAFARLASLRKPEHFGAWLVAVARFVCREWRRSRRRDRHKYTDKPPEIADSPYGDSDAIRRLRLAIANLPENERLALHLFYLQGESADRAREVMGLSHSGFYKTLAQARRRLAGLMHTEREIV